MAILPQSGIAPDRPALTGYLWRISPATRREIAGIVAELELYIHRAQFRPELYVRHTDGGPELLVHDRWCSMHTLGVMLDAGARYCRALPDDCALAGWATVRTWATTPGPDGRQEITLPTRAQVTR